MTTFTVLDPATEEPVAEVEQLGAAADEAVARAVGARAAWRDVAPGERAALLDAVRGGKQSGLGRELGPDAPVSFTEIKNVFIATEE